jgi:hypothetical protein
MFFLNFKISDKNLLVIFIISLINFLFYLIFFLKKGYLPSPFVLDKSNSFMDFYYPLYWVLKAEFYTTYQSVYPPLNYFLLKFFSYFPFLNIDLNGPYQLRSANFYFTLVYIIIFSIILFLTINISLWKTVFTFKQRIIVFLTLFLSAPFLFLIERGNIIIFALFFFSLYIYSSNLIFRSFYLALLTNIKPYFFILIIREIKNRETFLIFVIYYFIFFIFFLFGLGFLIDFNYSIFFKNYFSFFNSNISPDGIISLPHSLSALYYISYFISSTKYIAIQLIFDSFFWINLFLSLFVIYLILSKNLNDSIIIIGCTILLTNFLVSTGGYILIFYIPLIPLLIKYKHYKILFFLIIIFIVPYDFINLIKINFPNRTSFLSGDQYFENINLYLTLGTVIRPISNLFILATYIKYLLKNS